mmetsp:Transcript_8246/g.16261  ORF Transcript_8246/g.16261 Transcript_8246/m.16261 type:complete len:85 (+) Transcript_8246:3-257(+)
MEGDLSLIVFNSASPLLKASYFLPATQVTLSFFCEIFSKQSTPIESLLRESVIRFPMHSALQTGASTDAVSRAGKNQKCLLQLG